MSKLKRDEIIKIVSDIISHDRQNTYGKPENNFQIIANMWNEYLGVDKILLSARDVAVMMMLLKIARMKSSPNHLDNYIDAAGYSIIAASFCDVEDKK